MKKRSKEDLMKEELYKEVKEAEKSMNIAKEKLDYVLDEDLIDSYIFEAQALEKRYEYLLKQMKNIG